MSTHVMIDIETLGTDPDAVVLTIGGVKFDPFNESRGTWDPFYYTLEIEEQETNGRTICDNTINNFWMKPENVEEFEKAISPEGRTPVDDVLEELRKWQLHCDGLWAWGNDFDFKILDHLYKNYDRNIPWPFYRKEDARSVCNFMPKDPRRDYGRTTHNAMEDCIKQVYAVHRTIQHFGLTPDNCRF